MAAIEAQRLITVSLGKIVASRQQRGGINLHKNLLVACVLNKARTAYMMESFHNMIASRKSQPETTKYSPSELPKETVSKIQTEEHAYNNVSVEVECTRNEVSDSRVLPGSEVTIDVNDLENKENNAPTHVSSYAEKSTHSSFSNPMITDNGVLQESHTYTVSENVKNKLCIKCCGKRRRSRDFDCDLVTPKKPRMDNDANSVHSDYEDSNDGVESMQTETSQISSLVTIFNSGFRGLCQDGPMEQNSESESQSSVHSNIHERSQRLGTCHLKPDSVSCSIEVKVDSVSLSSVIALAV